MSTINQNDLVLEISGARFYADSNNPSVQFRDWSYTAMQEANVRAAKYLASLVGVENLSESELTEEVTRGFIGPPPSVTHQDQLGGYDLHCYDLEWSEMTKTGLSSIIARRLLETSVLQGTQS